MKAALAANARIKKRTDMKMNMAGTMSCKATSGVDICAPNTSSALRTAQNMSGLESPESANTEADASQM